MFQLIDELQARQQIDAEQSFKVWLSSRKEAARYRGSMYWRTVKGRDYLIKEVGYQDKSLGLRTQETERIYAEFKQRKENTQERLRQATAIMQRHHRLNAALRVGRAPNLLVRLLNVLEQAGIAGHFLIVGTNALYAYESMAGVRFQEGLTATLDVDLLWDSRKHLTLVSQDEQFNLEGLIGLLRKIDKTFAVHDDEAYRASNAAGFMVDLIKRRPASLWGDHEAAQLMHRENDFWAAKIHNMDWLLSAPRFHQVIVSVSGDMAQMNTVDPRAFILFKEYMAMQDDRDPLKKPRDYAQAQALRQLINERLPQYTMTHQPYFPKRLQ